MNVYLPRDDITESAYTVLIPSANFERGADELEHEAAEFIRDECEPGCACTPVSLDSSCCHILRVGHWSAGRSWRKSSDPAALDVHRYFLGRKSWGSARPDRAFRRTLQPDSKSVGRQFGDCHIRCSQVCISGDGERVCCLGGRQGGPRHSLCIVGQPSDGWISLFPSPGTRTACKYSRNGVLEGL